MSQVNVNQLLAQMRALASQVQDKGAFEAVQPEESSFSTLLKDSIDKVNETQQKAGKLAESFEKGAEDADLTEVMIALQKADLSFQAMTEVRNRLVSAYQEIMNMPV